MINHCVINDQSLDDQFSSEDNERNVEDCNRSSQLYRITNRKRSRAVACVSHRLMRKRQMKAYKEENGDCHVPTSTTKLGRSVQVQGTDIRKGNWVMISCAVWSQ